MQHPGRPEVADCVRAVGRFEIAARGRERLAEPGRKIPRASAPKLARERLGDSRRPQRAAQQGEQKRSVRTQRIHLGGEGGPVAFRERVERLHVARAIHREDDARSVRPKHGRRQVRVGHSETTRFEVLSQRLISRRGPEEDERRRHDVMDEAGRGHFFAAQAAANRGIALEHQRCPLLFAEHRGCDQRIDSAADEHIVVFAHASFSRGSFLAVASTRF